MKYETAIELMSRLIAALILCPIVALVLMLVWVSVIPDIFSGLVEKHYLPAALSFGQALGLVGLLSLLGGCLNLSAWLGGKNK